MRPQLAQKSAALQRIRVMSYVLDRAIPIPGTSFRFGLDPILGLVPVAGDVLGAVLSTYILVEAARFRLPAVTLVRMVFNILCETILGIVPIVGNIFDAAWKANTRNLILLEEHLNAPEKSKAADGLFFGLLFGGLTLILISILGLGLLMMIRVVQFFLGG